MQGNLSVLLLSLAAASAHAAPHKEIDLRNKTDANGEYSIAICARPSPGPAGLPGHAFVAYSEKPAGRERSVLALGFTTNSAVGGVLSFSSLLATPAGFLGEEKFTHMKEECLVILVNEDDFRRAYAVARPFYDVPVLQSIAYSGVYSLTNNDCESFATKVAATFKGRGVVVPPRKTTDLPIDYVRKLIDAN